MQSRRDFLKRTSLVAGAASVLPKPFVVAGGNPQRKLGVCLVGLGSYSTTVLAPALQLTQHCELRGIATGSRYKIPQWKEKYGIADENVYGYTYLEEVAENPDIDVVYIVLPTGMHAEYAIKAANAGKHVWCEKPMAMTPIECRAIIDACEANGVKLSVGYRMQHEPNTQRIRQWTSDKRYGSLKAIHAELGYKIYEDPNHWHLDKDLGGGYLYDLGVYPINAIRYFTGERPVAVTASHQTFRHDMFREVPEVTTFEFEFASGIKATGKSSAYETTHQLAIDYENGHVALDNFSRYNQLEGETSDGIILKDEIPNQLVKQMDADALAVINDTDVLVPGQEGLRDIELVQAIQLSAKLGGKVYL